MEAMTHHNELGSLWILYGGSTVTILYERSRLLVLDARSKTCSRLSADTFLSSPEEWL